MSEWTSEQLEDGGVRLVRITPKDTDPEAWEKAKQGAYIKDVTRLTETTRCFVELFKEQPTGWKLFYREYELGPSDNVWVNQFAMTFSTFEEFLTHPDTIHKFPQYNGYRPKRHNPNTGELLEYVDPFEIQYTHHHLFIAHIAGALSGSGAYSYPPMEGKEALEFASKLFYEWADGSEYNYSELHVYCLGEKWSDWFYGIAWDIAWVIYNSRTKKLIVFFATDQD